MEKEAQKAADVAQHQAQLQEAIRTQIFAGAWPTFTQSLANGHFRTSLILQVQG
jgi:hypothetical protein